MERRTLRLIISLVWMSSLVGAVVLLGADARDVIYAHEVFNCRVYGYSTDPDISLTLYPHSASGLFEVEEPEATLNVSPEAVTFVDLNCWARDAGKDALVVDATYHGGKVGVVYPLYFTNPPLYAVVERIDVEAGKRKEFHVTLVGSGGNVRVWLEAPSSSVEVSPPVDVGDVVEEEKVPLYVVTSPYLMGRMTLFLHVSFVDEAGIHHLKYEVPLFISPSLYMVAAALVGLLLALLVAFKLWKRGKPSPAPPNESQ